MMRFLFDSYVARATLTGAALVSITTHAALVTWAVVATRPAPGVVKGSIANHVFYIPPPDRTRTRVGSGTSIVYFGLAREAAGNGGSPRPAPVILPPPPDPVVGEKIDDFASAPAPSVGLDSVYSVLEVDTAVVRSSRSAAPAYPRAMLDAHITGSVTARYVVDTTGFADTASFKVLQATNPAFVLAVKEALPYMRFEPAKIGAVKVRQLVEQLFGFRIAAPESISSAAKHKP